MNENLTWRFDFAVIEWLMVLAVLVILAIVGAVITRQSLKAFRKLKWSVRCTDFDIRRLAYRKCKSSLRITRYDTKRTINKRGK